MIVKVFSDTHGYLPNISDSFDLLLIAGDITPAMRMYSTKDKQKEWFISDFKKWVDSLPYNDKYSRVFIVPGNHDWMFENMSDDERFELETIMGYRIEFLIHEEKNFVYHKNDVDSVTYRIFGTPFCKIFYNWAFMLPDNELRKKYDEIPEGLDFLITHDPPTLNDMGIITQGRNIGKNAGNEILSKRILTVKPKYVFSGHIHSGNHSFDELDGIKMANVSYVDERYFPWDDKILTFVI